MDIATALYSSALGIHRATEQISRAAARLGDPRTDDIVDPMADLILAHRQTQANMTAFRVASRLNKTTVDLLA